MSSGLIFILELIKAAIGNKDDRTWGWVLATLDLGKITSPSYPLQCSCLENPMDGGAWWAAIYGVAQSQTRLK